MSDDKERVLDRFGATDGWFMFQLWMAAEGHIGASLIALTILVLYMLMLPKTRAAAKVGDGKDVTL